ncbi:MAG: ERF family protein [Microcoleus sp. SIO2G3]|nr:ERF family protein [Microcoleus sp. SIO2G3]
MNELIPALIKARSEFAPIRKDKVNPLLKNKYATLDAVLEAVEPALRKHGLTIVQTTEVNGDQTVLKTSLYHESGQTIHGHYPLPQTDDPQKLGAAITYGRRYALCAILSVTADEDDDGNATSAAANKPAIANGRGTITKAEWEARKRSAAQA